MLERVAGAEPAEARTASCEEWATTRNRIRGRAGGRHRRVESGCRPPRDAAIDNRQLKEFPCEGGDVGVGSGWAPEWEWCDCSCGAGDGF